MASNMWRVEDRAYTTTTDKLGRTFRVYRAVFTHKSGQGYAARLLKKATQHVVELAGSQRKAAGIMGISLGKLQRELRKDV